MERYLFLTTQNESGQIPLPVMTVIALLLLMLPYLIQRYTGRSLTEWLRFSVIFEALEGLASKARRALFGKSGGLLDRNDAMKKADENAAKAKAEAKKRAAENREAHQERTRAKQRAGNVRNDYLQAVSQILTFARRNRLFAVIPGNVEYQGKTAELTALIVTHARIVGILAHGFDGTVLCRTDEKPWQIREEEGVRQIGCLNLEVIQQDGNVRGALAAGGLADIPYETVMLFTSSNVTLGGDRPENAYVRGELFEALQGDADLKSGPIDPKETGKVLGTLRAGKPRK